MTHKKKSLPRLPDEQRQVMMEIPTDLSDRDLARYYTQPPGNGMITLMRFAGLDQSIVNALFFEPGESDTRVEEGFDQHHIRKVSAAPNCLVEAANVLFGGDLWESHFFAGNRNLQFLPQRTEDAFEIGIVGPLCTKQVC